MSPPPPRSPLHDLLGFETLDRDAGRVVLRAAARDELLNQRGVLHGGVVAALLDSALGQAVVSGIDAEEWCGTLQLSVQFLEGARDSPFEAEGRMLRRGRRCAFAEGEVRDARSKVVARAHGIWYVWPQRPD